MSALPIPQGVTTINLADEGLSSGEIIDPYLEEHAGGSDTVVIPEGTYEWHGGGLDTGNGDIIGRGEPGDVVFEHTEGTMRGYVDGALDNVTIRGSNPESKSGIYPAPGAAIGEFCWPEGGQQSEDRAIYTSNGGNDRVWIENSAWAWCVNNGAYIDKPPVTVESCAALNNNIANIRVGHRDGTDESETTYIRNSLIAVTDDVLNDDTNNPYSRGLRLRHPAHLVVENCYFVYFDVNGTADLIELHDEAAGSTVEIRDCHFHNDTDGDLVRVKGDESGFDLTVDNCTFSGAGSTVVDHSSYAGSGVTEDQGVTVPTPGVVTGNPYADEALSGDLSHSIWDSGSDTGDSTDGDSGTDGDSSSIEDEIRAIAEDVVAEQPHFTEDEIRELAEDEAAKKVHHDEKSIRGIVRDVIRSAFGFNE